MKLLLKALFPITLMLLGGAAQAAGWQIDNTQSQLNFISIKKENVAEVHRFGKLSGEMDENGQFELAIALESVNTGIQIRDSRMRSFLFNVAEFPEAKLTANLSPAFINNLTVGQSELTMVKTELSLHDQKHPLNIDVLVTKVSETSLLVVSAKPVLLNVADYDLVQGVEKLRDLAGLPSISHVVPVSFYLSLDAK